MKSNPKVSIFCGTYNHEKYIRDALEGFLMQKTDFPFEIIVHDDASTDGTPFILKEYEKKYPDLIHVIYQKENQYSKFKYPTQFAFGIMRKILKGDYIALCDGDDYWVDENKLQIQVDYMENHADCVMTGHDAWKVNCQTDNRERFLLLPKEMDISAEQLIVGTGDFTTSTMVFRRDMLYTDDFFLDVTVGDYPLKLYCLAKGKIHYFDRAMSVYRYFSDGSWSSKQISNLNSHLICEMNIFVFLEKYNVYTKGMYLGIVKDYINERINALFKNLVRMAEEDFYNLCQICDADSDYEEHKYYAEMINLFKQYTNKTFLNHRVNEFIKKYKYIFIYGAGAYGKLVATQLQNNNIEFDGFIVSDNQSCEEVYESKKVWKISELLFKKKEMGVVIAVGSNLVTEILTTLQDNAIENYIYPFGIDCGEWIMQ